MLSYWAVAALAAAGIPAAPPVFSWDTVPVFMHSGNSTGPLNSNASAFFARFPIVTMGGFEGEGGCCGNATAGTTNYQCCNEGKISQFAAAVKRANNTVRVIFYQNGLINFPQTVLGRMVNPSIPESYLLHDAKGRLVYLGGCGSTHAAPNHTIYDHRQIAMREAWTQNVVDVMRANPKLVDGVFADRSGSLNDVLTKDLHCYDFDASLARQWDLGHWQAIANTQTALTAISPTAIVIGNHAEPTAAMKLTAPSVSWAAKMYEHFVPVRPYIPGGNQLDNFRMDAHFDGGLIVEVHLDFCSFNAAKASSSELAMYRRSLAAFLIGASKYSYYACTTGWGYVWDILFTADILCESCLQFELLLRGSPR